MIALDVGVPRVGLLGVGVRGGQLLPLRPGCEPAGQVRDDGAAPTGRSVLGGPEPGVTDLVDRHAPPGPLVVGAPGVQMLECRVVEVIHHELDQHGRAPGDPAEDPGQPGQGDETQGPLDLHLPQLTGADEVDAGPQHPAQDQAERGDQAERDALQQVESDDTNQGDDVHGQLAVPTHMVQMGDVDQPDPHDHQQPGQGGQGDPLDHPAEEHGEQQHPHTVQDRRCPRPRPGGDVGGTTDDDAGDRQAAGETGEDVGRSLAEQLTVEADRALPGTARAGELLHRDRRQQGFDARDNGDGENADYDPAPGAVRESRQRQRAEDRAGQIDPGQVEMERGGDGGPDGDRGQRRGNRPQLPGQHLGQPGPQQDDRHRHDTDQRRGVVVVDDLPGQRRDVVQGVAFRFTAEHDVQLPEDDGQPDTAEHAVHDRGRDRDRRAGDAADREQDLYHARGDGHRAGDPPSIAGHQARDDDRQPCRGAADLQRGTAERAGDDPADHGGDETGGDRRARGDRDAQRQRHRDQEHHQRRLQVGPEGTGHERAPAGPAAAGLLRRAGRRMAVL